MKLYLVRHGTPVPKEKNPDKPLTDEGRKDVERVAAFMKKAGVAVHTVFHSGKTRARETAQIMASKLQPDKEVLEKQGLSPLDSVKEIAHEIEESERDVMMVGHLPHMSRLVSLLTAGTETPTVVNFPPGGVVCLCPAEEEKGWAVAWMLAPDIVT